jgi:tetratricopeptide (TPR) repeat protein
MVHRLLAMIALLWMWPTPVHAAWLEAQSDHFVVYADDSEKDIRRFSDQLERYHAAMAFVTQRAQDKPSPSNRITVFVVRTGGEVRKLYGEDSKFVEGFYKPLAGRPVAVVSTIAPGGQQLDFSMITLLHEYAHHFMISTSNFPMPRWLSEGSAEFFSSASFYPDGSVGLGMPANHRAYELYDAVSVSIEDLLDPDAYEKNRSKQYDEFYGKSWALYHYMFWDKTRGPQLQRYFTLLTQGKGQREAALEAFGPFEQLETELDAYLKKRKILALRVPPSSLAVGTTSVRPLTAGEAAIMPVRIHSAVGVNEEQAQKVVLQARTIAAQFPKDGAVQAALAEAEYDAGNDKEALAASDAALAIDPKQVNAYVQKGYAMFRIAADAKDSEAAYRAARAPFLALNAIEQDHPLPLIWYYRSFAEMGRAPSPTAVEGLKRAMELAPFDDGLRMTLVMQDLRDHNRAEARSHLLPIAYAPHGKGYAKVAREMLARLDADPNWNGTGLAMPDETQVQDPE